MPIVHESAVFFTSLVVGLLTTLVLLLLPFTWQSNGRALRYWIVGNLALSFDRAVSMLAPAASAGSWTQTILGNCSPSLVVLGAAMHVAATRLLLQPERRQVNWRWPVTLASLHLMTSLLLNDDRLTILSVMACTGPCGALTLSICWPHRKRMRGALLMSGATVFILLMIVAGMLVLNGSPPGSAPPTPLAVLALDLVLSVVVNLAFLVMLIELLHFRVEQLSITDSLTGALNRRGFQESANLQIVLGQRMGGVKRAASVLLLDLDHFKRINDTLGHPMGDRVLQGAVQRLSAALRQSDVLGRWGGEEFVVLLPGSRLQNAGDVAERLREAIARAPLAEGAPQITISIGVAAVDELLDMEQLPALIAEADRRLYLAKRRRDCVVLGESTVIPEEPAQRETRQGDGLGSGVSGFVQTSETCSSAERQ